MTEMYFSHLQNLQVLDQNTSMVMWKLSLKILDFFLYPHVEGLFSKSMNPIHENAA